ncbi:MAG: type II secretion system F family protein [Candidatus Sungbacteria bacterium]|uniref:Type II secretion system F family protein n=1 Tax=Candidatus Sungiibacteriota bacterium TaxID=2750080 RepID=A0A932QXS3_9BACT|nr:type II secretion system F family protein [Candidatus Sungbacteria bacterium]
MTKTKEAVHRAPPVHVRILKESVASMSRGFHHVRKRLGERSNPGLSIKEQTFFVKRLSFLIKANVPILESLHMLSEQSSSSRYKRVVGKVIVDVSNGQSLAKSLGKFPKTFGTFGINIIKVGESSGTLSQNLDYLAEELRKRQILRRKVMSAFIYPGVITLASVAITAFLVLFLFPKIMPVFTSLHVTLPISTRILIAVTLFLQHWGLVLLGAIAVLVVAFVIALKKSKKFHFIFDVVILRAPLMGGVIRNYNLANLSRTLGLLLKSGLTLSEALPLTADTTHNLVYAKELRDMATSVNRGEQISVHLGKRRFLFADIMAHLIGVGERTGNLSNTLVYIADLYEAEIEDFTKNLSSLIEPILMIVMGIIVGFIAISIITPIYGITQNLHP